MPFRVARPRSGLWVKFDDATGKARAFPKKAEEATAFDTENEAKAAIEKALAVLKVQFDGQVGHGAAPKGGFESFYIHAQRGSGVGLDPALLKISLAGSHLRDAAVEEFAKAGALHERMGVQSIFALVSADGRYAKAGATGYWTFVDALDACTLFESAQQARLTCDAMGVARKDAPLMDDVRIVELGLSIKASLSPASLAPSDNAATATMRSIQERATLDGDAVSGGSRGRVKKPL